MNIDNRKKYNLYVFGATIFLTIAVYVFFEVKCFGSCDTGVMKSLFVGLLGLSASLLALLFFSGEVFISWTRHIAWWFLLGTVYFVASTSPYTSGVLSIDRRDTTIYCMSLLFIITLIYALIMNKKLKGNS